MCGDLTLRIDDSVTSEDCRSQFVRPQACVSIIIIWGAGDRPGLISVRPLHIRLQLQHRDFHLEGIGDVTASCIIHG